MIIDPKLKCPKCKDKLVLSGQSKNNMSICQKNHPYVHCPTRSKIKSKKLKTKTLWAIKRKESDEVYMLDSFYWTESDALRHLKESVNGAFRYFPENDFEAVKVKISHV